jgi:D-amino-acid dehydrogenase
MNQTSKAAQGGQVTIIGAGVVGMATAVQLQDAGYAVTVVDRLPPGEAASFGNAGGMPTSHAFPLGMPGMAAKLPGWLTDPLGPLALRWPYLPRLAPWLVRFMRASRTENAGKSFEGILALMRSSKTDWQPLLDAAGIADLVQPVGGVIPYRNEAALEADAAMWRMSRQHGLNVQRLSRDELRQLEPTLNQDYTCGMFEPDWQRAVDPHAVVVGLAEHFTRRGGTLLRELVADIETGPNGVHALRTNKGVHKVENLVICAGAWSQKLAARLGSKIPLESCRGYHIVLPEPGKMPRNMVFPPEFSCAITPMRMGLRFAGTAEFAGLNSEPNWGRARKLTDVAKSVFPGISTEGYTEWAGDRPIIPDSLPVIDRSPRHRNVVFAFGHAFYGLTLGAITGRLVTEIVDGRPPSVDLAPYRVSRF